MTSIPAAIYIIIGIAISFVSAYINVSRTTLHMSAFILLGVGFIAFGVGKIILDPQRSRA